VRRRLDAEMVRRGIAGTRAEAGLAIRSGKVTVSGRPAMKAGTLVLPDEPILLAGPGRRFASRGGDKLDAALERFGIDVAGRLVLDAGASTGGFTDCLLVRGAARVVALDVGHGQLDWRLREDPRVTVMERTNVRELDAESLPFPPEVVTADLSFISLRLALPALARCSASGAEFVLLVKPQFEAGREEVGAGGVVRDPAVWRRVLVAVADACRDHAVFPLGAMASPVLGPAGNAEFFLYATRGGAPDERSGGDMERSLDAAIDEALALTGRRRDRPTRLES
jgi:23S rRNA (cytidine1920-2'-O)/16S rRNA (cytidine1409-2'-O)-methyltransferase